MTRISTPSSSRWVAKLWRSVCGLTRLVRPAARAASSTTRASWRVLIGLTGFWPGNNQPPGNIAPWRRPSSHHVLSRVSRSGDSMALRSPWQNGHAERLIGSIRRECLDHVVIFGEAHLRQVLEDYAAYYNRVRTHLSLGKDAPLVRPVQRLGQVAAQ